MNRASFFLASALLISLTGCAVPMSGQYARTATPLGAVQDWRMPLYREPGRIELKMRLLKEHRFHLALETPNERIQAPVQLLFTGDQRTKHLTASVRYSTEVDVFAFKYFSKTLPQDQDLDVRIEWDAEKRTSVSIGGETIQVSPHTAFGTLHVVSEQGSVEIKEIKYSKLNEARESAMGAK